MADRSIKARVLALLRSGRSLDELEHLPARRLAGALLPALCRPEEQIKWPAATALGRVVSRLADEEPEAAREIMRRLVWSLNDESGSSGWGAPEAMAEILAAHRDLAKKFSPILISHLEPDGNFAGNPPMQEALLWAAGRLAEAWPDLARRAAIYLPGYLKSDQPPLRGLSARLAGLIGAGEFQSELEALADDEAEFTIFMNGRLEKARVGLLAQKALALGQPASPAGSP